MAFVELIELDQCRKGQGTFVGYHSLALAVFVLENPDRVVVLDNACPHGGGSLAEGEVCGDTVKCPWHQWEFDLQTGSCMHSALASTRRYPARIQGSSVWADLG